MAVASLILTAIYGAIIASVVLMLFLKRRPRNDEPPILPYWIPYIGSGLEFRKDPETFLRRNHKKYGPIFTAYMGGKYYHFISDPFTYASVAKERKKLCFRKFTTETTKKIFDVVRRPGEVPTGHGIFTKHLQGEPLEYFQAKMLQELTNTIEDDNILSDKWKERGLFDLLFSIMFYSEIDILCGKFSSSKKLTYEQKENVKRDFQIFDDNFPLIAQGYPYSACKGFLEARQRSWNFFSVENIQEREDTSPFIAETIETRISEGFANADATKQVYALMWAAAANTNTSVFWAIYFMITHPEALKAAEKEIVEMLEKTGQVGTKELKFTRAELEEMKVLNSIAYEAMRMTVSSASPRQATEDLDLKIAALSETRHIREGDMIMVAFQYLHFDEEVHPEPHKFKYDRFLNEDGTEKTDFYKNGKKLHQYVQPFGMGKSKCPGRHWAMTELKQAIIIFLTYMEFELTAPNKEIFRKPDRFMMGSLAPSEDPIIRYRRKELF